MLFLDCELQLSVNHAQMTLGSPSTFLTSIEETFVIISETAHSSVRRLDSNVNFENRNALGLWGCQNAALHVIEEGGYHDMIDKIICF